MMMNIAGSIMLDIETYFRHVKLIMLLHMLTPHLPANTHAVERYSIRY